MADRVRNDYRSPEALAFIEAVLDVCREHGFQIMHEDVHGAFIVQRSDSHLWWFGDAREEEADDDD